MPNILALETSAQACSVTLLLHAKAYHFFKIAERQQTGLILPAIQNLLQEADVPFASIDAIAFSAGPGSFTGIRLAASVAQGLAFGANLPLIPVSTLQVLAQGAFVETGSEHVLVLQNAYGGEIYWGAYQQRAGFMEPILTEERCKPASVHWQADVKWLGVGESWDIYAAELPTPRPQTIETQRLPRAQEVAQLAQRDFALGKFVYGESALPHYLHPASCWKKVSS